jgi:hypothetical protein
VPSLFLQNIGNGLNLPNDKGLLETLEHCFECAAITKRMSIPLLRLLHDLARLTAEIESEVTKITEGGFTYRSDVILRSHEGPRLLWLQGI